MAKLADAKKLVTDPANVTRLPALGSDERFSVNQSKVIRGLRNAGAGKAEARELALKGLDGVKGGVEVNTSRGAPVARGNNDADDELWWVPADAVRF